MIKQKFNKTLHHDIFRQVEMILLNKFCSVSNSCPSGCSDWSLIHVYCRLLFISS